MTRKLIDRSAWHHADDWRLYGVSPVRSNTIRRTRPDVSAIEHPSVKSARGAERIIHGGAKRVEGYVSGELNGAREGRGHESGRTLLGKVRPDS